MPQQLIFMNDGRLNKANLFTFMRLPFAFVGISLYLQDHRLVGIVVLMLAAWTDFFDGQVARRFNCGTEFGKKFDPIVDKIFMAITIVFAISRVNDARLFMLQIVGVEVLNALVTIYSEAVKKRSINVTWFGKKGMFCRMSSVCWLLLSTCGSGGFYNWVFTAGLFAGIAGLVLGLVAFAQYVGQARK